MSAPQSPSPSSDPARSFGSVVDSYDRARPGYPTEAVRWLTGGEPLSILELGAGTGKLTRTLVELGHDVHATDPDPVMIERLAKTVDATRVSQTTAEEIPAADASYDLVIAAQAFHWFDAEKALPEIARVLKRGGTLALVWNVRDERIPWVKRLGRLIGNSSDSADPADVIEDSPYFGPVGTAEFKHWQTVDRVSIRDLVRSNSRVATLGAEQQEAKLAEVLDFYDDFGRGMDGMQLPYLTQCYRAVVGIRPKPKQPPAPDPADEARPEAGAQQEGTGQAGTGQAGTGQAADDATALVDALQSRHDPEPTQPVRAGGGAGGAVDPPTDDDSGMLLIDFR